MSGAYDFEFPFVPPASCLRCGALVQDLGLHDEWHEPTPTDVLPTALPVETTSEETLP